MAITSEGNDARPRAMRTASNGRCDGVTLLEFLAALGIVVLLIALLLPAVARLRVLHRRLTAEAEVRQIVDAWERYIAQYKQWPARTKDVVYPITGNLARILSGEDVGGNNASNTPFMKFARVDAETNPVTPWTASNAYYFCRFDHDDDLFIQPGGVTNVHPARGLSCRVIVWATNMDVDPGASNCIVASWVD